MGKRKSTPVEEWITAAQAGVLLGVTAYHVKRLIKSGKLEGLFIGMLWMVNPDSLAGWTRKRAPNKPKDKPIE